MKGKAMWHLGLLYQEVGHIQAAVNTLETALRWMAKKDLHPSELADCYKGDRRVVSLHVLSV